MRIRSTDSRMNTFMFGILQGFCRYINIFLHSTSQRTDSRRAADDRRECQIHFFRSSFACAERYDISFSRVVPLAHVAELRVEIQIFCAQARISDCRRALRARRTTSDTSRAHVRLSAALSRIRSPPPRRRSAFRPVQANDSAKIPP